MFGKKAFNREEIEVIRVYAPSLYAELKAFLLSGSVGLQDADFKIGEEKFAEIMGHERTKYFFTARYQKEIILFSIGMTQTAKSGETTIDSLVSIHKDYLSEEVVGFLVEQIALSLKALNQSSICIAWLSGPSRTNKIMKYLKKMGFDVADPTRSVKKQ
jgi:hypothetical protein